MNSSVKQPLKKDILNLIPHIVALCLAILAGGAGKHIAPFAFPELVFSKATMAITSIGIAILIYMSVFILFLIVMYHYKRDIWEQIMSAVDKLLA